MTDNTQPLALMLADRLHHEQPTVLRIDAEHAGEELRRQHARIAELKARVQELGAMARENRSRRIVELEAQLEALRAAPPAEQQAAPKAAPARRTGTIAHIGNGRTTLTAAIASVLAAPQREAIGLVESAVTGAGGFHVRLAPGAQMPAPGTKIYTAPQQEAQEPAFWMNEKGHTWSHSDWKQFPKHRAKYPIPLYPHFPAPQQEAQEPVAYIHVPHHTVEGKVHPVVSFEKYQQDYADGIYSTRIPLYTTPQPAPAPLSDDVSQKTWALLDELEKLRSVNREEEDWDTLNKRDDELRAALASQGGKV